MISSPSPWVPCQLCCPVSPVRHCSLAQHEGRDSRAPQSWPRSVSPKPKVLGDPQVPAWHGVLPALSCAMMGTVPPHWDSTMLLHGSHPGTGPRSHSMRTGGYHDAGAVGAPWHQNHRCPRATQLSTPMLWVVLVLLSPRPLSRACAGSPSSRTPTPPCSWWPPSDPQGRLWVWHQGDHPLSLHPYVPTRKARCHHGQILLLLPALPGLRGRWAPGAAATAGSQPRPSPGQRGHPCSSCHTRRGHRSGQT